MGVFTSSSAIVAVGFAGPICLDGRADDARAAAGGRRAAQGRRRIDGVNLAYAVHSAHEGRGYAMLASCLALQRVDDRWGRELDNGFLNIQTREKNVRGNALLAKLSGSTYSKESAFEVELRPGETTAFIGSRIPWTQALQRAQRLVQDFDFVNQIDQEDSPSELSAFHHAF